MRHFRGIHVGLERKWVDSTGEHVRVRIFEGSNFRVFFNKHLKFFNFVGINILVFVV